jgi:hypothetical protein
MGGSSYLYDGEGLELFNSPLKELNAFFLRKVRKPMQGKLESESSTIKKLVNLYE